MKVKNIDLGNAFEKFKMQLDAVSVVRKETGEDYALQFGRLQGASKALLNECCGDDGNTPDDIPEELFKKPGIYGYNPD